MDKVVTYQSRHKKNTVLFYVVVVLLLILWVPVVIDKFSDFDTFKNGILNQPFSDGLGNVLIYTLPVLECVTVLCLISQRVRGIGLLLSTILMTAFTGYIGVALAGAWEKLPCGCGSVISGMSWLQHFFFNLFFLLVSGAGLFIWYKLRGSNAGSEATEGGSAKRLYRKKYSIISKI